MRHNTLEQFILPPTNPVFENTIHIKLFQTVNAVIIYTQIDLSKKKKRSDM